MPVLPDEIIFEILSPALKVSDSVFSDNTSDISPFANYSQSTSAYLVVCKSWLRVGTPLLYKVVILRSEAQANALSAALSGNKDLGKFIKNLRVEGRYGFSVHTILRCSPNISDLFLSLEIYPCDDTSGLCTGLELINPTRLIVYDIREPLNNSMRSQLVDALSRAIFKWDRLVHLPCNLTLSGYLSFSQCIFDCPFNDGITLYGAIHPWANWKIIQPLVKCERLHTIAIPTAYHVPWICHHFRERSPKVIQIKKLVTCEERRFLETTGVPVSLLKFTDISAISGFPFIAPPLNPFFIPMISAHKEVQDKIWGRVLYFAMRVPELASDPLTPVRRRRLALLLVSKTFNRVGLPHYYAHVMLRNFLAITKLALVLLKNPSICSHIRSLGIEYLETSVDDDTDSAPMLTILSRTTGLVRLSQTLQSDFLQEGTIPWSAFEAMAERTSSTLREFSVRIETTGPARSPGILNNFSALRTLEWRSGTSFLLSDIPGDALQNLEQLRISFASPSFLTVLSQMKLKSLRRVAFSGFLANPELLFLQVHGSKLTELHIEHGQLGILKATIFELCPSLCRLLLMVQGDPPGVHDLDSPQAVPSLMKISLCLSLWDDRRKDSIAAWESFFSKFEPKGLPNLHEINVDCFRWPKTEWTGNYEELLGSVGRNPAETQNRTHGQNWGEMAAEVESQVADRNDRMHKPSYDFTTIISRFFVSTDRAKWRPFH